ncbi:MAG TPA: hypothetical protein VLA62_06980, partial [Solirubrobacterales bacterium]|nr:hypothetical protein [Solirubrobacterales bacterium]
DALAAQRVAGAVAELQEEFERLHRRLVGDRPGLVSSARTASKSDERETASRPGPAESVEE